MRISGAFLTSRVARRMFALFVLCALIPTSAIAFLSLYVWRRQLTLESQRRLQRSTVAVAMSLLDRLELARDELETIRMFAVFGRGALPEGVCGGGAAAVGEGRFTSVFLAAEGEAHQPLCGEPPAAPLDADAWRGLASGKPALVVLDGLHGTPRLMLALGAGAAGPGRRVVAGEVAPAFLWTPVRDTLPEDIDLVVTDHEHRMLFASSAAAGLAKDRLREVNDRFTALRWGDAGDERQAYRWSLFLKGRFAAPSWNVILVERAPGGWSWTMRFNRALYLTVALVLVMTCLLSLAQIRRSLAPLEQLKRATIDVARGDFATEVRLSGADEFTELAHSFNEMTVRLGRQFRIAETHAELDRAILSALDRERIVAVTLQRIPELLPCSSAVATLLPRAGTQCAEVYMLDRRRAHAVSRMDAALADSERAFFDQLGPDPTPLTPGVVPPHLAAVIDGAAESVIIVPVLEQQRVAAAIVLARRGGTSPTPDELAAVRGVAAQLAVALRNARLVEELEQLNEETIQALALAVDAKSPWTAGHSHRVTELSLRIARRMGLDQAFLATLHRAGLLHDIGKIGVPVDLLDKPGPLTPSEWAKMHEHVTIGARILEPLSALAAAVPVARHHHEWWNGGGYPDGLQGSDLPLGARIVAVADVYDSLISERPYRAAWRPNEVIEFIRSRAGLQFDPQVVRAFLDLAPDEERSAATTERDGATVGV